MNRIAVLFVVSIAMTQVSTTTYAEELKTSEEMWEECGTLRKSGNADNKLVRHCSIMCRHVGQIKDLSKAEVAFNTCKSAYTDAINSFVAFTPEQIAASTPTIIELADIEGVYLRATRGRIHLRAEGRTDWQTHCNEMAGVIIPDNIKFFQTVRPNYRVRLVGVSYAPAGVKDRAIGCLAKSAVILEPVGHD
ncbi:hypothetical protein [Paraglaciecola arctica]|uniref:Uncharacterized protein n=1 Tax=Paraglaciecola arctica BSs20135 TaxID=493475 RepID=K6YBU6_9ALTE|nr:hypothetical protein [Paraglaciecola arctica]GAC21411.1 hypothetical protein GARC_4469 [Paraglaciecola arctica BSs20135]